MKNTLQVLFLLIFALVVSGAAQASPQNADATGVWLANDVPYAPWVFDLKQSGNTLTGSAWQSGAVLTVANVAEGTVKDNEISFKVEGGGTGGTISFVGTRNGDTIVFKRTPSRPGTVGDGLYGAAAVQSVTVRRLPPGSALPVRPAAAALGAGANTPAATVAPPSGTEHWEANDVGFAPWTFDLKITANTVTGVIGQARLDPATSTTTTLIGPFEIYDGKVAGNTIEFKSKTPDGGRIVTFRGVRSGDSIAFKRSVEVVSGDAGRNGILGGTAATEFVATRGTAAPVTALAVVPAATPAATVAPPSGTEHWEANDVGFAPWTFDLKITANTVTGVIGQARLDPATSTTTTLIGPFEIYDGKVAGNTIEFKSKTPDGGRIVTFRGVRSGDSIAFKRSVEVVSGDAGRNGILGGTAATEFVATRGTAAPATALAVVPAATPARGNAPVTATPTATGPAGRWQTTGIPSAPWTFEFTVIGTSLNGTVQQMAAPSSPVPIAGGQVNGTTISFKVLSPDAERTISFAGRVNGNSISFVREITPLPGGGRGGTDLYGGGAPLQFVATRVASNR